MSVSANEKDLVLLNRLQQNLRQESRGVAEFIVHLLEFDSSRSWARLGFSSLHNFCVSSLGLSDAEAATRIRIANLSKMIPQIIPGLAAGSFSLTGIRIMAPLLNKENFDKIMSKIQGISTREMEVIRAQMAPSADRPTRGSIRVVGIPGSNLLAAQLASESAPMERAACTGIPEAPAGQANPPSQPLKSVATPLRIPPASPLQTATEVRIAVTPPEDVWEKFRRVCDLTNRKCSPHQLSSVIEILVDDYLKHHDPTQKKTRPAAESKTRTVAPELPQQSPEAEVPVQKAIEAEARQSDIPEAGELKSTQIENPESTQTSHSRYIPRETRRAAWLRDQGQCSYVDLTTGRRCTCQRDLQLDHIVPFAKGGSSCDPDNIRLRCSAHNRLAADAEFGVLFMQQKIDSAQKSRRRIPNEGTTQAALPNLVFEL